MLLRRFRLSLSLFLSRVAVSIALPPALAILFPCVRWCADYNHLDDESDWRHLCPGRCLPLALAFGRGRRRPRLSCFCVLQRQGRRAGRLWRIPADKIRGICMSTARRCCAVSRPFVLLCVCSSLRAAMKMIYTGFQASFKGAVKTDCTA